MFGEDEQSGFNAQDIVRPVPRYYTPRNRYKQNADDQIINIVLYAVTLGLVALVVIDVILRFRR